MKKSDFVISLPKRLVLLLCMFIVCYILTVAVSYILGKVLSNNLPAALRMSALAQDIIAFILPAVGTAVFITRRPAELLCLTRRPSALMLLLVLLCTVVSIPAQEAVIYWNYNIQLPESMAAFEQLMRTLEQTANDTLMTFVGTGTWSALILNILIVGVAAAVSEELLFRGCFQQILVTGGVNPHVAIWLVAFVFSALHMQFFGFVPRMLLGAYFGYLLLWSGSIMLPIAAHMLNNVIYVIVAWWQVRNGAPEALVEAPQLWSLAPTLASVVLTTATIYLLSRQLKLRKE